MYTKTIKLNNGVEIPQVGLGVWLMTPEEAYESCLRAFKIGYRHIDTAQDYFNEEAVGRAVRDSGLSREEIFVTSKVSGNLKTYQEAYKSIEESLRKLDIGYIDLMIIHCPQKWDEFRGPNRYFKENIEVWKALEEFYKKGLIKAIGVSNFLNDDLENIIEHSEIKPMVNQVLAHISNTPFDILDYCKKHNVVVEAYSPIAHGALLETTAVQEMAKKYNVSVSQLCIKYCLEKGMVALPKARGEAHLRENITLDFEISKEDMDILDSEEKLRDYGKDGFFPVFKKA